mmetsp:Transcript_8661/g.10397  ORF Transcript_8661/g.10397 Transcript_8661/m.10397 type:complete len:223 (+) Transcript_8661:124-792(+)
MGDEQGLALLVSKVLGTAVIAGSLTVKLPIIRNCIVMKKTEGLSVGSLYTEIVACTISSLYSILTFMPLSSWGELLSVLAQNFILAGCIWYYNQYSLAKCAGTTLVFVLSTFTLYAYLPESAYFSLPLVSMFIGWSGVLPQIYSNHINQHTGPLSIITQSLNVAGSLARIFTTLTEVDDNVILFSIACSTVLQTVLLVQIITLRENTARFAKMSEPESKKVD